jgi:6,7-dimethyl-8-ribityllumazine synthase
VFENHAVEEPRTYWVPGVLDLPVTALALAEQGVDAIVCLGSVIEGDAEGETLDYVVRECASGLMQVQLETGVPCAFGVLSAVDTEQALARSGPKNNKGREAAESALDMANVLREIQEGEG